MGRKKGSKNKERDPLYVEGNRVIAKINSMRTDIHYGLLLKVGNKFREYSMTRKDGDAIEIEIVEIGSNKQNKEDKEKEGEKDAKLRYIV